ncbi:MAG: hypothetical protein J6Y02_16305 [Pseudobutyrivibrio sp.]|nr:hypothetical protein [Pseudobutyrivibrio sp.]
MKKELKKKVMKKSRPQKSRQNMKKSVIFTKPKNLVIFLPLIAITSMATAAVLLLKRKKVVRKRS